MNNNITATSTDINTAETNKWDVIQMLTKKIVEAKGTIAKQKQLIETNNIWAIPSELAKAEAELETAQAQFDEILKLK